MMKGALRVAAAIFSLWLLVHAVSAIQRASYIYPSSETQSKFFRTYTVTDTVNRFKENHSSFSSGSQGASAGHTFVTYQSDKREYFVLKNQAKAAFTAAVEDDISDRLLAAGARITEHKESADGLAIKYELGNSRGLVLIAPLQPQSARYVAGPQGICPGEAAVMMQIRLAETWSDRPAERRTDWPAFSSL